MSILRFLAASSDKIDPGSIGLTSPPTDANSVLANVLTTVYAWAGIVCIIIVIIGGFLYVTSASNASQVKRAKDAIIGAIVGLVIVIMAFVITQFVLGRF
jgi:uncharacterized membrane protein YagU involved in acid resistance